MTLQRLYFARKLVLYFINKMLLQILPFYALLQFCCLTEKNVLDLCFGLYWQFSCFFFAKNKIYIFPRNYIKETPGPNLLSPTTKTSRLGKNGTTKKKIKNFKITKEIQKNRSYSFSRNSLQILTPFLTPFLPFLDRDIINMELIYLSIYLSISSSI